MRQPDEMEVLDDDDYGKRRERVGEKEKNPFFVSPSSWIFSVSEEREREEELPRKQKKKRRLGFGLDGVNLLELPRQQEFILAAI